MHTPKLPTLQVPNQILRPPASLQKSSNGGFPGFAVEDLYVDARGRLILPQLVLSAIVIYHLSLDPPPWVFKAIDKIRRAFLWKGTDAVERGKYTPKYNQDNSF
jgi:hypothetical protein